MIDPLKTIFLRVVGTPKGQPRPRAFVRNGRAAVYDPGTAEGWKSQVAAAAKCCEGLALTCPVSVDLRFYMPRPKSHFGKNGELRKGAPGKIHTSKPDVDNLAKSVLDALTGIGVWRDDAQVCRLSVTREWQPVDGRAAGCDVSINELADGL